MQRQPKAADFNFLDQCPNGARSLGSVRPIRAGVLIARRLQPRQFPERSRLAADFTGEGGFVAKQGDYSLVMPRPMGVWPAFKVQSPHFPDRAFSFQICRSTQSALFPSWRRHSTRTSECPLGFVDKTPSGMTGSISSNAVSRACPGFIVLSHKRHYDQSANLYRK